MEIDKSHVRKIILEFPRQFKVGLQAAEDVPTFSGRPKAVLVCGMGGSVLPADILSIWLQTYKIALPLYTHRNYELPHYANNKYFIICISYSGNTEETLSALEKAREKNLKIAAITSGGKLAELCQKYQIPVAIMPAGLQPRMALGFQFAALIKILVNIGVLKNNLKDVANLENLLKPKELELSGKKLAKKIKNKVPLIYASERLRGLAYIWKIKFNEDSKIPAFYNYFPELNHNELVGFENAKLFHLIILRDPADHPRILKRMALTAEILREQGLTVDIIDIKGEDILYKVFSTILLGDWTSYYLALERGVDPFPVKLNDQFKKRLTG